MCAGCYGVGAVVFIVDVVNSRGGCVDGAGSEVVLCVSVRG